MTARDEIVAFLDEELDGVLPLLSMVGGGAK